MSKSPEINISDGILNASNGSSGIHIEHIKSRKVLYINGWFDSVVGIGGVEIPVSEFCRLLDIKLSEMTK